MKTIQENKLIKRLERLVSSRDFKIQELEYKKETLISNLDERNKYISELQKENISLQNTIATQRSIILIAQDTLAGQGRLLLSISVVK